MAWLCRLVSLSVVVFASACRAGVLHSALRGGASAPDEAGKPAPAAAVHDIGAGRAMADQGMTFEEWCAAKNTGMGPPISRILDAESAWRPDSQPTLHAVRVPGITDGVPAVLVHGVLTPAECETLIRGTPSEGEGVMSGERVSQLYRDRVVKERVLSHDLRLASALLDRLAPYLPRTLDGGRLLRVNPGFRFVHYEKGGHQACHIDGREPGAPLKFDEEARAWVQSRLTVQVYLNSAEGEDFEGGELAFFKPGRAPREGEVALPDAVSHTIKPRAGDVVVFYQERLNPPSEGDLELQHEAYDVRSGHKRICRTMVDYAFDAQERAHMGNCGDEMRAAAAAAPPRGKHRVLALGNTILDTVIAVPSTPMGSKVSASSCETYVGGQAANAAQAMAHLGLAVDFATRLGDDEGAHRAEMHMAACGVGLAPSQGLRVPGARTSAAAVVVAADTAERTCFMYFDKALRTAPADKTALALADAVRAGSYECVYVDGHDLPVALPVAAAAHAAGLPLVVDAEEVTEGTRRLAKLATYLIAPRDVLARFAGVPDGASGREVVLALGKEPGCTNRTVIATDGEFGAWGLAPGDDRALHAPALAVSVRDSTGAGDAFHGGFVAALLDGRGLREAMDFATRLGACACLTPGPAVTRDSLERCGILHAAAPQPVPSDA